MSRTRFHPATGPLAALIAAALLTGSTWTEDAVPYDVALSRLRACAATGAAGAPSTSLVDAVVAVRSLCRPQINRAYSVSDEKVAAENPTAEGDALAELRSRGRKKIDYDLAVLISTSTGLTQ